MRSEAVARTRRLDRAADLVAEASGTDKRVEMRLAMARESLAGAASSRRVAIRRMQLDDARVHLRAVEEVATSNDVLVPVRNALQLVAAVEGGERRV
jgi:hypothetical protein